MRTPTAAIMLVPAAILILASGARSEDAKPRAISQEAVSPTVTRITFADGTVKLDVKGRDRDNPLTLLPPAGEMHAELVPSESDKQRGYTIFVPKNRRGVLPEYRPEAAEVRALIKVFACPGQLEPVSFCIRPLQNLGIVRFEAALLSEDEGKELEGLEVDLYVVQPTVEQIKLTDDRCRWVAKWLRPVQEYPAKDGQNVQVYVDMRLPEDARPGNYTGSVRIIPQQGEPAKVTVELEILPLKLARPMPWGCYRYDWHKPDKNA